MDASLMKKIGLFAGGVLFGTAGLKILTSSDAKKVYTHSTAAALRAKECVMKTVTDVQENAEDILAEAKEINRERTEEVVFSDEEASAGEAWSAEHTGEEAGEAKAGEETAGAEA